MQLIDWLLDENLSGDLLIKRSKDGVIIQHNQHSIAMKTPDWQEALLSMKANQQPILRTVFRRSFWYQIEFPAGFPFVDSSVACMLRSLGDSPSKAPLLKIPDDERKELMLSLAQTLTRTEYHTRRFEYIIETAIQRKLQVGGTVYCDHILHYAYYEAAAALIAARSMLEQVYYIVARKCGLSERKAKTWNVSKVATETDTVTNAKFNTEEVKLLQGKYKSWYLKMNNYRNVIIHQGWKYTPALGYYEPGTQLPEAASPIRNPLILPDLNSLTGSSRTHKWTFNEQVRFDLFMKETIGLLFSFIEEIGKLWGGTLPRAGTIPIEKRPNLCVSRPLSVLMIDSGFYYLPLFSKQSLAEEFFQNLHGRKPVNELFKLLPAQADSDHPVAGFRVGRPDVDALIKAAKKQHAQMPISVRLILDASINPASKQIQDWIVAQDLPTVSDMGEPDSPMDKLIILPLSDWADFAELYMFRTAPNIA